MGLDVRNRVRDYTPEKVLAFKCTFQYERDVQAIQIDNFIVHSIIPAHKKLK